MPASQDQAQSNQGDEPFVALQKPLRIQEARLGSVAHSPEYRSSDNQQKEFLVSPGIAPAEPLISVDLPRASFQSEGIFRDRRSVGGRVLLTVACGFIIVVIVGTALAWQSVGEKTKDIVRAWGISLSQMSSVLGTKSPAASNAATAPISKGSEQASVADGSSPEPQQKLETMANDLAVMRRIMEQIAAKQEQMVQDIATLQAAEQKVSEKIASLAQLPASKNVQEIAHSEATLQPPSVPVPIPRPRIPLPLH